MATKTVYGYDSITGKFTNTLILDNTDRSPVTKSWQIPAGYTEVEVLTPREGYDIIFNAENNSWSYVQIPVPEPEPEPTLEEVKANKIQEFKLYRDTEEVAPITTAKGIFDYDDKSRDRLQIARQSLTDLNQPEASIIWTTADNQRVPLQIEDFAHINSAAAVRSNELHIKYNQLKTQVNQCNTKEEVENIQWNSSNE